MRIILRHGLLALLLLAGGVASALSSEPADNVPLLRIIANPQAIHGKKVIVFGYCRLEFEAKAIHLNREDYKHSLGNAVWIEIPTATITERMRQIGYCVVVGTYNANERGHFGAFHGTLEQIERFEPWPPRQRGAKRN